MAPASRARGSTPGRPRGSDRPCSAGWHVSSPSPRAGRPCLLLPRHEVLGLRVVADQRAGGLLRLVLEAGVLGAVEADARPVEQLEDRDIVLEVGARGVAARVAAAAVL